MLRKDLHEENRLAWNEATLAHNSHKKDQADFFSHGGSTLFPEEIELLGDISGLSLVHLQCNAGQDTLSLAHLAAKVTGVDISDTAIDSARILAQESGIPADFYRADVYEWMADAAAESIQFDVVFSSYGALIWLSEIDLWARNIASILRPGGRLVVLDFHPFAMIFEEDWSVKYSYFAEGEVLSWEEGVGDYVAMSGEMLTPSGYLEGVTNFKNPYPSHEFQWSIGEIMTAVINSGMMVTRFKEYPFMNGAKLFHDMRELSPKRMYPPEGMPNLPLMFGLVAEKAALP